MGPEVFYLDRDNTIDLLLTADGDPVDLSPVSDVILEIDLRPIGSVDDWNAVVAEMDEEANPMFTILRDGRQRYITLGE